MKGIEIKLRKDFIIVEKTEGKSILNGSTMFCGVCGGSLGVATENIPLPTNSIELQKKIKDKTFRHGIMGTLYHASCGHSMFSVCGGWKFISLENYFTETILQEVQSALPSADNNPHQ